MFRLQDNTPEVYTQQSRDFQLFCRLYDCINNGVMFDISTMPNILDANLVNDLILPLMCTKVGFFPKDEYDSEILRNIISIFPYAIKHKGTKIGIEVAVFAILKGESNSENLINVLIDSSKHSITINTLKAIKNQKALDDLLSYIIPTGYFYNTEIYVPETLSTIYDTDYALNILYNKSISASQVRGTDRYLQPGDNVNSFQFQTDIEDNYIATFQDTEVIGSGNNTDLKTYSNDVSGSDRDNIDKHEQSIIKSIIKEG